MSRNFELLRRFEKQPETLEITPAAPLSAPVTSRDREAPRFQHDSSEADWLTALDPLKKHWRIAVAFAIAAFALTAAATFIMRPTYEPSARAEIAPPGAELFSLAGGGGAGSSEGEFMETQSKNLESDQLAINVIRKLQLDHNAEFYKGGKNYKPAVVQGTDSTITLSPGENEALRIFSSHLTVKRDTGSRLVTIKYASHDPVLSAHIVNTLLEEFVQLDYETRHKAIMQSSEWLAKQLDDIKLRMEQANKALSDFQRTSGIAAVSEGESTVGAQMAELNRQLTTAQADRIQLQALLGKVQGADTSAPQITSDPVLQDMTKKLGESRAELSQALAVYGKNHPNVRKLQNQVDELESQIAKQRQHILSGLKTSYAAAQARENLMQSQMKDTTKQMNQVAQYEALRKEADANIALYNSLYGKIKEAGIAAESKSSNIRVIDHARVLAKPTRPNIPLNLALGLFGGVIGGVLLAFVRERFDRNIYTADDIRKYTGISSVSVLPLAAGHAGRRFISNRPNMKLLSGADRPPAQTFLLNDPHSPEAEALRGLYTSVRLSSPGRPPQCLLVASCFPGEGKTTVAINLAIALAQNGTTCVIDGDLRRPGVARAFGINCTEGIGDVLVGSAALEDVLVPLESVPNLTILPAAPNPPAHPGELVSSTAMSELLNRLRQQFDFVLVDSPPILPYAEGRAIAPQVDGVILVGRAGYTNRQALSRSMELLTEVHSAPILEVVLNGADFVAPDYRYYSYGYGTHPRKRSAAS